MTYPHTDVQRAIAEGFVPYQINMVERHPDFKEACAGARVSWGPTFIVADGRGLEVRRWVGWLPPDAFIAELAFCRALAAYTHGDFAAARDGFTALVDDAPPVALLPEALYWQGIAGFMAGKFDWDALRGPWERVAREFPDSRFGIHASVIEDAP